MGISIQRTPAAIDEIGKNRPDSRIWGSRVMMASWIAWPCVCETVEMKIPMLRVTNRKSRAPSAKAATDPRKGTEKIAMPAATITTMSIVAIAK